MAIETVGEFEINLDNIDYGNCMQCKYSLEESEHAVSNLCTPCQDDARRDLDHHVVQCKNCWSPFTEYGECDCADIAEEWGRAAAATEPGSLVIL